MHQASKVLTGAMGARQLVDLEKRDLGRNSLSQPAVHLPDALGRYIRATNLRRLFV